MEIISISDVSMAIKSFLEAILKDSIESFKQASRDDLIEIEQSEINIITELLQKMILSIYLWNHHLQMMFMNYNYQKY